MDYIDGGRAAGAQDGENRGRERLRVNDREISHGAQTEWVMCWGEMRDNRRGWRVEIIIKKWGEKTLKRERGRISIIRNTKIKNSVCGHAVETPPLKQLGY